MPSALSIKIGDLLYKHAFPVYNLIYPVFKRRQDKEEIALLKNQIKPGDTVLDIGANIGFYTRILSELVGETGSVYAFEPDTTNFGYLEQNARHLKNVTLKNQAVSDRSGTITLYKSALLNIDHKTYASTDEYTESYEVETVCIDDLMAGKRVDFIKIDIQGFEYFAFQGMINTFASNPDLRILTEFYPNGIKNSGVSLQAFFGLLWDNRLHTYRIENGAFIPVTAADLAQYEQPKDRYFFFDLYICKSVL